MRIGNKTSTWLFTFLVAGFIIRVILLGLYGGDVQFTNDDDSKEYLILASNMEAGRGFSQSSTEPFMPDSFRTPGYPFFILISKLVLGSFKAALVLQALLVSLTAFFVYKIGSILKKDKTGLIAAVIFLFMPFSLLVSVRFLTQVPFTFLLVSAVYCWLRFLNSGSRKYFWLAVVILPLLAYIRPIGQWVYLPFMLSYLYQRRPFDGKTLKDVLIVLFVFYAALMPWLYRNGQHFGRWELSSISGYQLYFYDAPAVVAANENISYGQAREQLESEAGRTIPVSNFDEYMEFEHKDTLTQKAIEYMTQDISSLIIVRLKLLFSFFTRDGIRYWFEYWQPGQNIKESNFIYAVIAERLVLLGLLFGAIRTSIKLPFIRLVVIYFAILSGAVSSAGLRFPVEPLILLLGVMGLADLNIVRRVRTWYDK